MFALHCRASGIKLVPEFKFHPERQWKADFLIVTPDTGRFSQILVEIDGGGRLAVIGKDGKPYAVGRHAQINDYEKMAEATLLGFRVFRFTPKQVQSGYAIRVIEKAVYG